MDHVSSCSIGSCHRHGRCMYTPCRSAAPERREDWRSSELAAVRTFDQRQDATAEWMGYPDAAAMNRDHDTLHAELCRWLGVTSHSMRLASGATLTPEESTLAALEEDAVLHLQRFMRHSGSRLLGDDR
jgi:hypothetical protein